MCNIIYEQDLCGPYINLGENVQVIEGAVNLRAHGHGSLWIALALYKYTSPPYKEVEIFGQQVGKDQIYPNVFQSYLHMK